MGVFNCSKACLQYSRIIFQSAVIFKVLQDVVERLEVWRCFFAYGYRYRSNRLIQLYQVAVFQCQQPCLEYFKIIDFIITIHTRQSKKINFFCCIQINIRSSNKLYLVFSIVCFRHTQSSLSCKFIVFEGYLNFFLWLYWLRQQRVVYLEQSQETFFVSVLLTGVQLDPVSYLLFISVFGG